MRLSAEAEAREAAEKKAAENIERERQLLELERREAAAAAELEKQRVMEQARRELEEQRQRLLADQVRRGCRSCVGASGSPAFALSNPAPPGPGASCVSFKDDPGWGTGLSHPGPLTPPLVRLGARRNSSSRRCRWCTPRRKTSRRRPRRCVVGAPGRHLTRTPPGTPTHLGPPLWPRPAQVDKLQAELSAMRDAQADAALKMTTLQEEATRKVETERAKLKEEQDALRAEVRERPSGS